MADDRSAVLSCLNNAAAASVTEGDLEAALSILRVALNDLRIDLARNLDTVLLMNDVDPSYPRQPRPSLPYSSFCRGPFVL